MQQRVAPCTTCHGKEGQAAPDGYYPRIAGKPAGYLYNQLLGFRDGRRHFATMTYLVDLQRDDYLREIAAYFGALREPYAAPEAPKASAATLERGRVLAVSGDPARHVPACEACHGARLLGVAPDVPGLLGVSEYYLIAQLNEWRSGIRAAPAPDCMAEIVHRMRPADVDAVGAWLAMQSVPAGATPAPAFKHPPPLECGSIVDGSPLASTDRERGEAARHTFTATPEQIARGRELVTLADCQACHTARGGKPFAGGRAIPTAFGTFFSPNITPDPRTGIGRWSEADFWHALHDGYAKGGTLLYPSFPYTSFTQLTRADVDAMYAYLRTVPPVSRRNRAHELAFPYGHRSLLRLWRLLYFRPGVYRPDPAQSAAWNRGAYLVQAVAHCGACHEPRNALGATRSGHHAAGALLLGWYAPSLENPREAGLQGFRVEDIVTLLSTGQVGAHSPSSPHASTLGPMAEVVYDSLQHASGEDLEDMALYLKSLPSAASPRATAGMFSVQLGASRAELKEGRALYDKYCSQCHGSDGEGRLPAAPPLAGDRAVTMSSDVDPIRIVLFGGYPPGTAGNPRPYGMPPFYPTLRDGQIAAVLTYVRASWGNAASPVLASQVESNRGSPLW